VKLHVMADRQHLRQVVIVAALKRRDCSNVTFVCTWAWIRPVERFVHLQKL